eukprot:gnl/MRDRNA2_/MRDRNA2_86637_c1_seq1.p1 gnl/MRDRNA2_/MRDRNA2_86637_c1~~gnl/MRDRNA2_/MRDRNA2_86637_c1_seq1.p1  ORF type:complete len:1759 (+),score=330.12 gnl/MRDRNA2_/MRDRNA2_86637_c1_seq1:114-5390(+)
MSHTPVIPSMEPSVIDELNDTGEIGHECGFAMLRLLKPLDYYMEKYGTNFYGLNRMYLVMEKQRNRGQDGAGVATLKLDVRPGCRYIDCYKSVEKDCIADAFKTVQTKANEELKKASIGTKGIDVAWMKEHVPFAGELILSHIRYGTDSNNDISKCHPVLRESNWMTRNLILAGNFNITNNEELFSSLVRLGQHPRDVSDTVMLLEKIGHFVDKENNDLYVKYSAAGHDPRTCFSLIAETMDVKNILRRASTDWDGGYCIAGMLGHGDAFVMRDPSGIRPAFYYIDDEIAVVASEAPVIQSTFQLSNEAILELPPSHALIIKRSGAWSIERIQPPRPHFKCSFERIYFSRGNDQFVNAERQRLGAALVKPVLEFIESQGDGFSNTVLAFIPNTSELAFCGMCKEAQAELERRKQAAVQKLFTEGKSGPELQKELDKIFSMSVRTQKVVQKDAKIRTFIQEESSREHLTVHAYDINYGTVRRGEDILVAVDDSIVRGNTLKNALIPTLARLGPKGIIFVSSAPQIRYPDPYGIDMAKLGDLCAFKAAITLLKKRRLEHIITEVYRDCKRQLSCAGGAKVVNHVRRIYEPFTTEEISEQINKDISPPDLKVPIKVIFQSIEDLHGALPDHKGDWYFSGKYPTNGGAKVCCRAFVLWMEGSNARCYGVNTALSRNNLKPVLMLGGGGREHALAWKLSQSPEVGCIYITPGNGGTVESMGHESVSRAPLVSVNVPIKAPDFEEVVTFCREHNVQLVVVGPEQPLVDGIADVLQSKGISVFGPSKAAAQIEESKVWAKEFMTRHNIPTAEYQVFKGKENLEGALAYVHKVEHSIVVKASGLAAGKGVTVPRSAAEAEQAVRDALEREKFGQAGEEIVIERCLEGRECSIFALCDGKNIVVLPAAQDYKRAFDGDQGPNTGGMGAFAPTPVVTPELLALIEKTILQPTVDGMAAEGRPFIGCLFAGLMVTESGPQVLEFNCRFGDPETQVVIPLLDCDLYETLHACVQGKLGQVQMQQKPEMSAVTVVMASGGYPNSYQTGYSISGIDRASCVPGAIVFHAGTRDAELIPDGAMTSSKLKRSASATSTTPGLVTSGGRVLAVTATGRSVSEARERAYVAVRSIRFSDAFYRKDIANFTTKMMTTDLASLGKKQSGFTYLDAGVDLHGQQAAAEIFGPLMRCTERPGLQAEGVGETAIGGICSFASRDLEDPVLISSTSSVGTKLSIANLLEMHKTVGRDIVALCANDVASRGVQPLFFLNHLASSKLEVQQAQNVVKGISDECVVTQCTLLSVKTAEMPGIFSAGESDLIGFVVGVGEAKQVLPKLDSMQTGDVLIGLPSSGIHSNGFSLIRSMISANGVLKEQCLLAAPFDPTRSLGEALMTPTKNYSKSVLALAKAGFLKGAAPITSGGLCTSIRKILPPAMSAELEAEAWELPPVFRWLAVQGKITTQELANTFNCGIGMVLVVAADVVDDVMKTLKEQEEEALRIGELKPRAPDGDAVTIESAESSWLMLQELGVSLPFPSVLSSLQDAEGMQATKTVVLVGSRAVSALQSLVKATAQPGFPAEIVAVVSVDGNNTSLQRYGTEGFVTRVLAPQGNKPEHLDAKTEPAAKRLRGGKDTVSSQLVACLHEFEADLLVILDDVDLTILSKEFRQWWYDKTLVLHSSLLPAFPGRNTHVRALEAGACVTGCTVHFLSEHGDEHGHVVVQETTRVLPNDNGESLERRVVEECEWKALPEAVQMFASGKFAGKFKTKPKPQRASA